MTMSRIGMVVAATAAAGAFFGWIGERLAGGGGAVAGVVLAVFLGVSVGEALRRRQTPSPPR
jgi:hypothetical protein